MTRCLAQFQDAPARSAEEECTQRSLAALNNMRIKFPGKSDDEAEYILDRVSRATRIHTHTHTHPRQGEQGCTHEHTRAYAHAFLTV